MGKYEYAFDFRILESKTEQDNSYLFIAITPVLSKDNEPTLPVIHVAFNFNEKGLCQISFTKCMWGIPIS